MPTSDRAALAVMLVLATAACSRAPDRGATTRADGGQRIACAHGAAPLGLDCLVERADTARGPTLTLRRPDGGFRRLLVTRDGRGVVAADGAEPVAVTVVGPGLIEARVGGDRYRLPATVKGGR